jgi:hypothetical protein
MRPFYAWLILDFRKISDKHESLFGSSGFLALNWNTVYQMQYRMELDSKKHRESEEKEWENPLNPAMTSDERDKEQLLRQYKEAKRRKNNLSTEENETKNKN